MDRQPSRPGILDSSRQASGNQTGSTPEPNHSNLHLDALFLEGDDNHYWNPDDWTWDPYHLSSDQREAGDGDEHQVAKRRRLQLEPGSDAAAVATPNQLQGALGAVARPFPAQPDASPKAYQQPALATLQPASAGIQVQPVNLDGRNPARGAVCQTGSCPCWANPSSDCGCPCCEQGTASASTSAPLQMSPYMPPLRRPSASPHGHQHSSEQSQLLQQLLSEEDQWQGLLQQSSLNPQQSSDAYQHQALLLKAAQIALQAASLQQGGKGPQLNLPSPAGRAAGLPPGMFLPAPGGPPQRALFSALHAAQALASSHQRGVPGILPSANVLSLAQPRPVTRMPSVGEQISLLSQTHEVSSSGAVAPAASERGGSSGFDEEGDSDGALADLARRASVKEEEGGRRSGYKDDPESKGGSVNDEPDLDLLGGEDGARLVCQVPGCGKDLQSLKDYHQRYHICDVHIKLSQVMKDGRLQRFCQQCGRFHDLGAFDGNRKSCREQLSKHNARRRRKTNTDAPVLLPEELTPALDEKSEIGRLLQGLIQSPFQLHALRILLGIQTHPAMATTPSKPGLGDADARPRSGRPTGAETSSGVEARDILSGTGRYTPGYEPDQRVVRLSVKLFNREPSDLPGDLRQSVHSWLGGVPAGIESYIRPGCVFLTLHIVLDEAGGPPAPSEDSLGRLVKTLTVDHPHPCWTQGMVALQLEKKLLIMNDGVATHDYSMTSEQMQSMKLPAISHVSPLCLCRPVGSPEPARITLQGRNIRQRDAHIICRSSGTTLTVDRPQADIQQQGNADAGGAEETLTVSVQLRRTNTVIYVEANRGAFLSEVKPFLVVDDPGISDEINRLELAHLSGEVVTAVLTDIGYVLQAAAGQAPPYMSPARVVEKARRLLAFACEQGWPAMLRRLLPLAALGCSPVSDMVNRVDALTQPSDGLGLLHRAVRSGSYEVVQELFDWGAANHTAWPVDFGGPRGITPLHLAALQEDGGRMLLLLLEHSPENALTESSSSEGVTPFHMAFQMGLQPLDALLQHLQPTPRVFSRRRHPDAAEPLKRQAGQPAAAAKAAAAPAAAARAAAPPGPPGTPPSSPAAAAAAGWRPLGSQGRNKKPGKGSLMGPCTVCMSNLPPLLLSATSRCFDCNARISARMRQAIAAAGPPDSASGGKAWGPRAGAAQRPGRGGAGGRPGRSNPHMPCLHQGAVVHQLVGLCQTCHAEQWVDVM